MEKKLPEVLREIKNRFTTVKPVRVMFQDEARFGRISQTRRCWHKKPHRPLVKTMLTHQYTYAYGVVSPIDGRFDSLILPAVNGHCMQLFLDEIGRRYPNENLIMVVDGAGWHKSKQLRMPENIQLHFLPPYSPQLNPQEHLWDELREKHFHNRTFESIDALEDQLERGLKKMGEDSKRCQSITGWEWIIKLEV